MPRAPTLTRGASLPPLRGPGGCCPGADALRARGADSLLRVDDGFREGLPRCPLLRWDGGACRLRADVGVGVGTVSESRRAVHPKVSIRRSSVLSFRCLEVLPAAGRGGTSKATVLGSRKCRGICLGHWDPAGSSTSCRKRSGSRPPIGGEDGGGGRRAEIFFLERIIAVTVMLWSAPRAL